MEGLGHNCRISVQEKYGCCNDKDRQVRDSGGIEEHVEGEKVEAVSLGFAMKERRDFRRVGGHRHEIKREGAEMEVFEQVSTLEEVR